MYPLCASFGCHHHMSQILWRRVRSKKLTKPEPNNGLCVIVKTRFQMSVRPVRVEFLPRVPRRPPPESVKSAITDTANIAKNETWIRIGSRRNHSRLVSRIKIPAITKQDKDVAE